MAPRARADHVPSSPSSKDSEAASQQLLAEASSPVRRQPAAVVGANLLNAARLLPRPPTSAVPARTRGRGTLAKIEKPGKLKRASLSSLVLGASQKISRGANLYDINPSPQKRASLPALLEAFEDEDYHVPLVDEGDGLMPETSQVQPDNGTAEALEKGNAVARSLGAGSIQARAAAALSGDSVTSKRKAKEDVHESATNLEPSDGSPVARKQKKLRGPKLMGPDSAEFDQDLVVPPEMAPQDVHSRGDLQPQIQIPVRATRSRTAQTETELDQGKNQPATTIPSLDEEHASASTQSNKVSKSISKPKQRARSGEAGLQEDQSVEPEDGVRSTGEASQAEEEQQQHPGAGDDHLSTDVLQHAGDEEQEDETNEEQYGGNTAEVSKASIAQPARSHVSSHSTFEKVFKSTESDERDGVCLTNMGRKIHRMCDKSRVTLSRSDLTLDDISRTKMELTALMSSTHAKVREDRRVAFKRDAFAHLFRSLTLVLKAMHDKLQEKEGHIIESLDSVQILYLFVKDVLRFKGTLDGWKVKVPQRTVGDRLIKDVESDLIVPLRDLEKELRPRFGQLKKAERTRLAFAELQRERQEEEQQYFQKEMALNAVRERRKRWQDLHIIRMQCEPDVVRRRRLRFVEPIEVAETDANGRQFERVPFFGERSMPPPQWIAASSGRDWTKEQETVLLDALQSFTNIEQIIEEHCGVHGALRDFSVSDIAAKLAWVRSGWAQLSHQHGWQIPQWVKGIPVLP